MSYFHWLGRDGEDYPKWAYYGPCFPPANITVPPVDTKSRERCLARFKTGAFRGAPA